MGKVGSKAVSVQSPPAAKDPSEKLVRGNRLPASWVYRMGKLPAGVHQALLPLLSAVTLALLLLGSGTVSYHLSPDASVHPGSLSSPPEMEEVFSAHSGSPTPAVPSANLTLGACVATKTASGAIDLRVNATSACLWNVTTLKGLVPASEDTNLSLFVPNMTVSGGGVVNLSGAWKITLGGDLTVTNGTVVSFNRTDFLTISNSSTSGLSIGSASRVLLNGITLNVASGSNAEEGGSITVSNGTLFGGVKPLAMNAPSILSNVTIAGPGRLRSIALSSTSVYFLNMSSLNISTMDVEGSYARTAEIQHVSANYTSIRDLRIDNAYLTDSTFQQVGNLTVGNSTTTSPDHASIVHLSIPITIAGTASFAHTSLGQISWSGASRVLLVNSTLESGAQNVTEATSSFNVSEGSVFDFPVVINATAEVVWVNSTAPSLDFNGKTRATVYNWNKPTNQTANGLWELPSITVQNHSASVKVYRYLRISVQAPGGGTPTSNVTLKIENPALSPSPTVLTLPPSALYGLFLYTDNLSGPGYAFVGTYTLTASADGTSATRTVNVTAVGQTVVLQLTAPPSPSVVSAFDVFLLEVGALVATVAGTLYLIVRTRRISRQTPPPSSKKEETPATSL